jgi:hypothetical protein
MKKEKISKFAGYRWWKPKSGGARGAGAEGGFYEKEDDSSQKAIIKQDKIANTMAEYLAAGIFRITAPENSAEVDMVSIKNEKAVQKNGKNQYLVSKFVRGYATELFKLMGFKERPKMMGTRFSGQLAKLFKDIVKHNSIAKQDRIAGWEARDKEKWEKITTLEKSDFINGIITNRKSPESMLRRDFALVMIPSLFVRDADVTTGNIGAKIDKHGMLRLVRLDYGWAFYHLKGKLHPHSIRRFWEFGKPTNHYVEYPEELRFSKEMVEEIFKFTAQKKAIGVELDKRYAELAKRYNDQAFYELAKHLGFAKTELKILKKMINTRPMQPASEQVIKFIKEWHYQVSEKRYNSLQNYASDIEIALSISKDGNGVWQIDKEKLREAFLKNPNYMWHLAHNPDKIHFRKSAHKHEEAKISPLVKDCLLEIRQGFQILPKKQALDSEVPLPATKLTPKPQDILTLANRPLPKLPSAKKEERIAKLLANPPKKKLPELPI